MEDYNFFKNPKSLYGQPEDDIGVVRDVLFIDEYVDLYEKTIKVIYEQKISAFEDFYSFCQFNDSGVSIAKSDFFLIQSFIIYEFKKFMTEELTELGNDIGLTFDFEERDLKQQENIILNWAGTLQGGLENYVTANTSDFLDNFKIGKHLSKFEKALKDGKTEIDIFKFKFLKNSANRINFRMPKLRINYSSFAINTLRGLASLNLVTFIGEILVESIYNALTENRDTLAYFKRLDSFLTEQKGKHNYFVTIKGNFDSRVESMILDLKDDLVSIYEKVITMDNDAERQLFNLQMKRKHEALLSFVNKYKLKTTNENRSIDHGKESYLLEVASIEKNNFLKKQWALFNMGSSYDKPKKTSIHGPEKNKWRNALRYLIADSVETEDEHFIDGFKEGYIDVPVGVKGREWVFLEQILHEGLKLGVNYEALKEVKKGIYSTISGIIYEERGNVATIKDVGNDRLREVIIKKIEGSAFYFESKYLYSKHQTKVYFKTCGGNVRNIESSDIFKVGIKILDLNEDISNSLVLLDSIEFQILYYKKGSDEKQVETATEWISYG